jgi:hypothetical protein
MKYEIEEPMNDLGYGWYELYNIFKQLPINSEELIDFLNASFSCPFIVKISNQQIYFNAEFCWRWIAASLHDKGHSLVKYRFKLVFK